MLSIRVWRHKRCRTSIDAQVREVIDDRYVKIALASDIRTAVQVQGRHLRNGVLTVGRFAAGLYGGTVELGGSLDATTTQFDCTNAADVASSKNKKRRRRT